MPRPRLNLTSAHIIFSTSLLLALFNPCNSIANSVDQPPHWVKADDVRVRSGPSAKDNVIGTLPRCANLILKDTNQHHGFCLTEDDGRYGYIAC